MADSKESDWVLWDRERVRSARGKRKPGREEGSAGVGWLQLLTGRSGEVSLKRRFGDRKSIQGREQSKCKGPEAANQEARMPGTG